MEPKCKMITRVILPAVRAAVADELSRNGYTQQQIAGMIGVAQVAVSKYLNGKYSKKIENTKNFIIKSNMLAGVFDERSMKQDKNENDVKRLIERLCDNRRIMEFASSM